MYCLLEAPEIWEVLILPAVQISLLLNFSG
jgi:hypothetical protein